MAPCGSGDFCNGTKVCERRHSAGQSCTSSSPCETGLSCIGAGSTTPATCRGPGAEGEACAGFIGHTCQNGLYCSNTTPSLCSLRVSLGDPCTTSAACPDSSVCLAAADGSVRCSGFLEQGQACVSAPKVGSSGCRGGLKCDPTAKTCINKLIREGHACTTFCTSAGDLFRDTLYCDQATRTCKCRPAVGEACTPPPMGQSDACSSPSMCDATTRACAFHCA